MSKIIINARRQGYATDQISHTMTVGQLIDFLQYFDEDAEIYLGHDMQSYGWYTYGGIDQADFFDEETLKMDFGIDFDEEK